jgi:hypothetical protein
LGGFPCNDWEEAGVSGPLTPAGSFHWLDAFKVRGFRLGLTLDEMARLAMVKLTIWR